MRDNVNNYNNKCATQIFIACPKQTGLTNGWHISVFHLLFLLIVLTVTLVVTAVLPKRNEYVASVSYRSKN
jgi:hypothetical protein